MIASNRRRLDSHNYSNALCRGRYYVDPVCRADDDTDPTDQEKVSGATSGHVVTGRYNLPSGLTCSRCIVQMVYCESLWVDLQYLHDRVDFMFCSRGFRSSKCVICVEILGFSKFLVLLLNVEPKRRIPEPHPVRSR